MMARAILACALALPLLAGCAGSERPGDDMLGARGPTADHVRGVPASGDAALRPEPGNIWSEGLAPSQPLPNR